MKQRLLLTFLFASATLGLASSASAGSHFGGGFHGGNFRGNGWFHGSGQHFGGGWSGGYIELPPPIYYAAPPITMYEGDDYDGGLGGYSGGFCWPWQGQPIYDVSGNVVACVRQN
jgi:hypothetical protein